MEILVSYAAVQGEGDELRASYVKLDHTTVLDTEGLLASSYQSTLQM